jgi:hypothetical protein
LWSWVLFAINWIQLQQGKPGFTIFHAILILNFVICRLFVHPFWTCYPFHVCWVAASLSCVYVSLCINLVMLVWSSLVQYKSLFLIFIWVIIFKCYLIVSVCRSQDEIFSIPPFMCLTIYLRWKRSLHLLSWISYFLDPFFLYLYYIIYDMIITKWQRIVSLLSDNKKWAHETAKPLFCILITMK